MRFTVEELRGEAARGYATMFADWIGNSGRRNNG